MPASAPGYAVNTSVATVPELQSLPTNSIKSGDTGYVRSGKQPPITENGATERLYLWEDDDATVANPASIVAPIVGGVPVALGRWFRMVIQIA